MLAGVAAQARVRARAGPGSAPARPRSPIALSASSAANPSSFITVTTASAARSSRVLAQRLDRLAPDEVAVVSHPPDQRRHGLRRPPDGQGLDHVGDEEAVVVLEQGERASPTTWSTRPSGVTAPAVARRPASACPGRGTSSSIIDRVMASAPRGDLGLGRRGPVRRRRVDGPGFGAPAAAGRWPPIARRAGPRSAASLTVTVPKSMRRARPWMSLTGATTVSNRSPIVTAAARSRSPAPAP